MTEQNNKSTQAQELLQITSDVVAAFVSNNAVAGSDVSGVIRTVHAAFSELGDATAAPTTPPRPAIPVKKSVQPDYIVCLEDGKQLKMLKRHLRTSYGLTPEEYRAKWGLPHDYPMVAPNYAKQRSQFAKDIGLGKKPKKRRKARV